MYILCTMKSHHTFPRRDTRYANCPVLLISDEHVILTEPLTAMANRRGVSERENERNNRY